MAESDGNSKSVRNQKCKTLIFKSASIESQRTPSCPAISSSSYFKCVCLHDWWLLRPPDGKGLAVGGFSSREGQHIRFFSSAAIAKRHDTNTLETADGFTITVAGFINRSQTHKNGFPPEVCNYFHFGFPYNWEVYATKCSYKESRRTSGRTKNSVFDNTFSCNGENISEPISTDPPVTRVRDLLMLSSAAPECHELTKRTLTDLFGKLGGKEFQLTTESIHSKKGNERARKTADSVSHDTSLSCEKVEVKSGSRKRLRVLGHSRTVGKAVAPPRGVATRSMTSMMQLRPKDRKRTQL